MMVAGQCARTDELFIAERISILPKNTAF